MTDQEWCDCGLTQPLVLADLVYLDTQASKRRLAAKDSELYMRTRDAMLAIGMPGSDLMGVSRLLLAILYLGNLDFGTTDHATIDADAEPLLGPAPSSPRGLNIDFQMTADSPPLPWCWTRIAFPPG